MDKRIKIVKTHNWKFTLIKENYWSLKLPRDLKEALVSTDRVDREYKLEDTKDSRFYLHIHEQLKLSRSRGIYVKETYKNGCFKSKGRIFTLEGGNIRPLHVYSQYFSRFYKFQTWSTEIIRSCNMSVSFLEKNKIKNDKDLENFIGFIGKPYIIGIMWPYWKKIENKELTHNAIKDTFNVNSGVSTINLLFKHGFKLESKEEINEAVVEIKTRVLEGVFFEKEKIPITDEELERALKLKQDLFEELISTVNIRELGEIKNKIFERFSNLFINLSIDTWEL